MEAEADYTAARELYAELGNTTREAVTTMMVGRAAFAQGDLDRAEKLLRDAVRTLKGIGDRGSLCEAQRALAMVLVEQGARRGRAARARGARDGRPRGPRLDCVDDASRSGSSAQRRTATRRQRRCSGGRRGLLRSTTYGRSSTGRSGYLAEFLRSRGREDEAVVYEERRAALSPSSTAPIV